jgi:hypothetical protein
MFTSVSQAFEPAKGAEMVARAIEPLLPTMGLAAVIMSFFALTVPWVLSLVLKDPRLLWTRILGTVLSTLMGMAATYVIEPLFAIHTAPGPTAFVWTFVSTILMWTIDQTVSDELES